MPSLNDAEIDSILFGSGASSKPDRHPARGVEAYGSQIDAAAAQHGVDPQIYRRLIRQESGGNPAAISPVGARGLVQLMPGTARGLGVTDPHDPAQAIPAGARYLRQQLDKFGGDYSKALAAYNAGPGAVAKYNGIPPFAETQAYVRAILGDTRPQAQRPTGKKLSDSEIDAILGIDSQPTPAQRLFPVPKPNTQLPQAPATDATGQPEWLRQNAGILGKIKPGSVQFPQDKPQPGARPGEMRPQTRAEEIASERRRETPSPLGSAIGAVVLNRSRVQPKPGKVGAALSEGAAIGGKVAEVPFSMLLPNMHRILAESPEKINDGTALEQAFVKDYGILRAGNQAEALLGGIPYLQKISTRLTGAAKTKFTQALARVFSPAQMAANFGGGAAGQALLDAGEDLTLPERAKRIGEGGVAAMAFGGALRTFKIGDHVAWEPSKTSRSEGAFFRDGATPSGRVVGRASGEITIQTPDGRRVTIPEDRARPLPPLQEPGTPAQIPGKRPLPGQVGRPKPKPRGEGVGMRPKPSEMARAPETVVPIPEAPAKPVFDPAAHEAELLADIQRRKAARTPVAEATAVPEPVVKAAPALEDPSFSERLAELQKRAAEVDAKATEQLDAGKTAAEKARKRIEASTWEPESAQGRYKFRDFDKQPRLQIGAGKALTAQETDDLLNLGAAVTSNKRWHNPEAFANTYEEIGAERADRVVDLLNTDEGVDAVDSFFNRLDELEETATKKDTHAQLRSTGSTPLQLLERARHEGMRTPEGHKRLPILGESDAQGLIDSGFTKADLDTLYQRLNTKGRANKEYTLAGSKYSLKALIYDAHTLPNDAAVSKPRGMKGVTKTVTPELPLETPALGGKKPRATDRARTVADKLETDAKAQLAKSAPMARRKKGSRTGGTIHPDDLEALGKLVAAKVIRGTANLADALEAAARDWGEDLKPHAEAIYAAARKHWDSLKDQHGKGEWPAEKPVTAPKETPAPERPAVKETPPVEAVAKTARPRPPRDDTAPAPDVKEAPRRTTGLRNVTQKAEVKTGELPRPLEKGKSDRKGDALERGKAKVLSGEIDPAARAKALVAEKRTATSDEFGAFQYHAAELRKKIKALKEKPASVESDLKIEAAQDEALDFLDDVEKSKTSASDAFRALQGEVDIDTGDWVDVQRYARKQLSKSGLTLEAGSKLEKELKDISDRYATTKKTLEQQAKSLDELNAELRRLQSNPRGGTSTRTRTIQERKASAVQKREQAVKGIDDILKDVLPKLRIEVSSHAIFPGAPPAVKIHNFDEVIKAAPQMSKHVADYVAASIDELGITAEEAINRAIQHLGSKGVKITPGQVAQAYDEAYPKVARTVSELTKQRQASRRNLQTLAEAARAKDAGEALTDHHQTFLKKYGEAADIPEEQLTADYFKKREAELQRQLEEVKQGPFVGPKEGPKPTSEAIEKMTAELKALREQKGASAARDARIRDLEARLAKVQAGPEMGPKFKREEADAEIKAIQEQIADAQAAQRLQTSIDNAEGFVKREQARIDAGDYAADPVKQKRVEAGLKKAQDHLRGLKARRRVLGEIDNLNEELRTGNYRERVKRAVRELSDQEQNERARLSLMQREVKRRIENERTPFAVRALVKVRDLSRNLQTTLDDSAGRQLWKLGFSDPDIPAKGYFSTFKPSLSDEGAERFITHLETGRRNSALYRGRIELRAPNEFVPDHIIAKWKKGNPFAIAERRYNLRLNLARVDLFDRMVAQQRFINKLAGISQDLDKSTLDRIGVTANTLTGKGLSKTDWEEFARKAATISYAPGYAASELQSVTGAPFWQPMRDGDSWDWKGQRSGVALQYAKTIAGVSTFYALYSEAAKLSGDTEPVLDFRDGSTTFGQVRVPFTKQWINPIGGAQGWVRLASQLASQKRTNVKGQTRKLTMKDAVTDLLWNKAHPNVGMAAALHGRKDFKGDEYPPRNKDGSVQWWRVPVDLYSPITPRNFALSLLENGWTPKAVVATMLEFNGLGVMDLEKASGPKPEPMKPAYRPD